MSIAPHEPELQDVPAITVCVVCGQADCPGHEDHDQSVERPISLPWEQERTLGAFWSTAIDSAMDLDKWARASLAVERGVFHPALFAIFCETLAVVAMVAPLTIGAALVLWPLTYSFLMIRSALWSGVLIGLFLIPIMIAIHVTYHWSIDREASKISGRYQFRTSLRAGLFACGWDLATGPLGVLSALLWGNVREAWKRLRSNSTLYREGTEKWLLLAHFLAPEKQPKAIRAARPWMALLISLAFCAVVLSLWWSFR